MATYVKGNPVANATSYELFEKVGSAYNSLKTGSEINFDVSALGLPGGNHTLVVKAKADGYEDSDYSNEVVYKVEDVTGDITSQFEWTEGYRMTADKGAAEANPHWITSDYVDISAYSKLQMTMPITTATSTNSGCAFYDASKTYISGVNVTFGATAMSVETKDITVPAGAVYIRTMWYSTAHPLYTPDFAVENFNCLAEV